MTVDREVMSFEGPLKVKVMVVVTMSAAIT